MRAPGGLIGRLVDRRLLDALVASMWAYGGRATGLLWTVLLIASLGVGDYGRYAMACAVAAIVAAPLDNPFNVRAIREDEDAFRRERRCRVLLGLALVAGGTALAPLTYIGWYGLTAAGGEIAFNAVKSRRLRDADPGWVNRADAVRQVASVAAATAYLLLVPSPTLAGATTCYVAVYAVPLVAALMVSRGDRPQLPGAPRERALLFSEHLGGAAYLQGDVLLLGALAGSVAAGQYALCTTVAWAVASLGQAYIATYHVDLRDARTDRDTLPPASRLLGLALGCAFVVLMVAAGLAVFGATRDLWLAMVLIAGFAGLRCYTFVLTTVLAIRRRDLSRVSVAWGAVPIKLALVALLAGAGAPGAAVAAVVTDLAVALASWRLTQASSTGATTGATTGASSQISTRDSTEVSGDGTRAGAETSTTQEVSR